MSNLDQSSQWRIKFFLVLFVLAMTAVGGRAFQLQVLKGDEWQKRAERQYQRMVKLTPQRGPIVDRNGEALALSVEVDSVYINPKEVDNKKLTAEQLASRLGMPKREMAAKLKSSRQFVWVKRQISPQESKAVRALDLPGVHYIKEHKRFYPNGRLAAQLIGFTGLDPRGLEGLELKYDGVILGEGGFLITERDAVGQGLGGGSDEVAGAALGGKLELTIDKSLQFLVEKELGETVKRFEAASGTVVMLEPSTGRILAMASKPDFNPNNFGRFGQASFRNRAVTETYEPGSIMKSFLLASALAEGLVTPQTVIDCENGSYWVGGKEVNDHHRYEDLTVAEIIKFSSNIGSAKIGKMLERQRLFSYLSDFGFGQKTGIELPGEVRGTVHPPRTWFEYDLAAVSFGQGMTATPLQLAAAMAAIANGGVLMRPYLVERVVGGQGEIIEERYPEVVQRVIPSSVAATVRSILRTVTEEGGTGTRAAISGYGVAGKTGTAEKVDLVTGGYSVDKRVSSFLGMVPADNPELVILVLIDEPKNQTYGGLVAGPAFSRIGRQALAQLQVTPSNFADNRSTQTASLSDLIVVPELPLAVTSEDEGSLPRMPSLLGMSYRQVLQVMERTGLNLRLEGSGRVVEQQPSPHAPITYGKEVRVKLEPPVVVKL